MAVLIGPEGGFAEHERATLAALPNVVRIALGVCFFFVRGRAPAKRHIASLGAVREYRDLAEGSPLNRAAVLLVQQFAHALLRRGIMLQQDEIGDRTDDAVPGEVPCPGRRRNH